MKNEFTDHSYAKLVKLREQTELESTTKLNAIDAEMHKRETAKRAYVSAWDRQMSPGHNADVQLSVHGGNDVTICLRERDPYGEHKMQAHWRRPRYSRR